MVPDTVEGRIVCVVFGLFGIPLMLVTIADIGKFIGEGTRLLYIRCRRGEIPEEDLQLISTDQDSVPVLWILLIIVGYTALGGLILPRYENWTFEESFYFSFITMSTIGMFTAFFQKIKSFYEEIGIYNVLRWRSENILFLLDGFPCVYE